MIPLHRLLAIFCRNRQIKVIDEDKNLLFNGTLWLFDNKYYLSCFVTDVYLENYFVTFVIAV